MNTLMWRIGGPQGSGIDRAALLFARLSAKHGLHVLARREYHSNISGRHSYSDVRAGEHNAFSHSNTPQVMVCLDAESICRHIKNLGNDGCIILDKRVIEENISHQKLLEEYLQQLLCKGLHQADLPCTIGGLLEGAKQDGVTAVTVEFDVLFNALRSELDIAKSTAERSRNVIAVAISCALLGLSRGNLYAELKEIFHNKPDAITLNSKAVELAYDYAETLNLTINSLFRKAATNNPGRIWVSGSQSVALGKLAAGLGMQTYYPISPATDESMFLEKNPSVPLTDSTETAPLIVQTEDELAAFAMACGASLTGARASTSTSGPGFSLMVEGLGWAGMTETPVVVSLYQRGGPSTGMPTRTEQGDLQFVIHAGHGEFPRIVMASGDVEECFYDAFRAFNYAEQYQLPVIHLLDKSLASATQTIPAFASDDLLIERGELVEEGSEQHIPRFAFSENGISPRPQLGRAGQRFWMTGVEHTELGLVTESPTLREDMMEKRAAKLALAAEQIPQLEKLATFGDVQADTVIISWGSNKGCIIEAVNKLIAMGKPIYAIQVKLLWPFPTAELQQLIGANRKLVVAECNQTGQFCQLLERELAIKVDHLLLKYTGRSFVIEEMLQTLQSVLDGTTQRIITHQNEFE